MKKECEVCGMDYEGKKGKYTCGAACQKARQRAKVDTKVDKRKVDTAKVDKTKVSVTEPVYVDPPLRECETYNERTGIIRKQCLHGDIGIDYTLDQNGSRLVHVPEGTLGRKSCKSKLGDRYCSCGAEIHGTVRPRGKHEVLLTSKTRHLYSYFTDYRGIAEAESRERIRLAGI